MADLTYILPNFDLQPWRHLTFSLEKKEILTAEIIALDAIEIAKRCPLPLKEVRRFQQALLAALQVDMGLTSKPMGPPVKPDTKGEPPRKRMRRAESPKLKEEQMVRTLDEQIDQCILGFPTGKITEIVGESAAGKTQFVLSLLLSAQLAPPQGLGRPVIYFSTEDALNTTRLKQMLKTNPAYQELSEDQLPNFDNILSMTANSLEAQEHIIQYQLPEMVKRSNAGLIVIDSIAANYRAEFQGSSKKTLAQRALSLVRTGSNLRKIAHDFNVAIVVTNQVSDRFDDARTTADKLRLSSQIPSSSGSITQTQPNIPPSTAQAKRDEIMSLDFQQRFFTGWGDKPGDSLTAQKTPALGLTWANQIDARIVLKVQLNATHQASNSGHTWSDTKRRRFLGVVFAAWAPPTLKPVEYTLEMQGLVSVPQKDGKRDEEGVLDGVDGGTGSQGSEHPELLDPKYWEGDDEEFP